MKLRNRISTLTLAMLMSSAASATTLSINNIKAQWFDHVGGSSVTYNPGGAVPGAAVDTTRISWGGAASAALQSAYNFNSTDNGVISFVPPPIPNAVNFGVFTHENKPVLPNAISSVKLKLFFDITASNGVDADLNLSESLEFLFEHNETDNSGVCEFASVTPCADQVLISLLDSDLGEFAFGGSFYKFTLLDALGFSVDGINAVPEFITQEGVNSSANLILQLASRPDEEIPEPATLALLGLGALGLAALRRKSV